MFVRRLLLTLALLGAPWLAAADPAAQDVPVTAANPLLLSRLMAGMTLDGYLQRLRQEFRQLDADSNGVVESADIALHDAMTVVLARAGVLQTTMSADLDGDGFVTEDELRQATTYRLRLMPRPGGAPLTTAVEAEVKRLMAADTDHDGRISYAEALAFADAQSRALVKQIGSNLGEPIHQLLELSPGEGKVTLPQVEMAGEMLFRAVDADKNGTVSREELNAYRGRPGTPGAEAFADARRAAEQGQAATRKNEQGYVDSFADKARKDADERAGCAMPKASDKAEVALVGLNGTEALADVTVGSQDVATGTAAIVIEPGETPLYVVAVSFRPVIWRVTGAVQRVERLVLASAMPGPKADNPEQVALIGAMGLPGAKVTLLKGTHCLASFTEVPSTHASEVSSAVATQSGKQPSVVVGRYQAGGFTLPAGTIQSARQAGQGPKLVIEQKAGSLTVVGDAGNVIITTGNENSDRIFKNFYPGGVVKVDPLAVVASRPPEPYAVLPQQAGLMQLVASGALTRNQEGEYLIHRKIRFPAELTAAQSARFLLLRGVPMPDGDPGLSCVIVEETGQPLKRSATCPGG